MRQLTSLQLHVSCLRQTQQQQLVPQQLAALLEAVGKLQRCKQLSIMLDPPEGNSCSVVAAAAAVQQFKTTGANLPLAPLPELVTLQPIVQLSSCLQSLQVTAQQRLPVAALVHLACLSRLTALHLECSRRRSRSSSSSSSVPIAGRRSSANYEEGAVAALLPVMPQLQQLALLGYFEQPQQQHHEAVLPQPDGSSMLPLLQHLQPSTLTALDLGHNSPGRLPFPAAAHPMAALTRLRSLGLAGAAVAAADLAVVGQGLRCLTRLDLRHSSDAELAAGLAGSDGRGDVYGTAVLPLQHWLGHCSGLQELLLGGRALTAHDIAAVQQQLLQLTALDLSGAHTGASALAHGLCSAGRQGGGRPTQLRVDAVARRKLDAAQLVRLSLHGTRLGPDGLLELAAAAAAAARAPAGLASSSSLAQLRELDLRGCRAGGAAVAALRRALPGLQVVQLDGMDWAEPGLEWLIGDY
ncbi:hypothetical protein COO60DRAFT_224499 [Scenedesmus sp. NREL 46B-D3]|nr:hypothetical protein COO60DRAFT_224499 [Scenedesmus sp. NREL 46B-D3]